RDSQRPAARCGAVREDIVKAFIGRSLWKERQPPDGRNAGPAAAGGRRVGPSSRRWREPAGLQNRPLRVQTHSALSITAHFGQRLRRNRGGQKVLIHADSGGVGTFAIQLAKHVGAIVATTTSAANLDWVKASEQTS